MTPPNETPFPKPIGYWLKHLDNLISTAFEQALSEHGVTRRHWQVLTNVAKAARTDTDLDGALTPFQDNVRTEIDDLVSRGWLSHEGAVVSITDSGRTAHETVAAATRAVRTRMSVGISREEYLSTVDVLARMSANLA